MPIHARVAGAILALMVPAAAFAQSGNPAQGQPTSPTQPHLTTPAAPTTGPAPTAAAGQTAAPAQPDIQSATRSAPVGHLTINARAVAAGVGYTWGGGTLTYRGHHYTFNVKGLSVLDVGEARISGSGSVYNLKHLRDFSGTYAAADAEATAGTGSGVQYLRNANGVVIKVTDTTRGARLQASADGVELTLK
jgi:hypothetical protein